MTEDYRALIEQAKAAVSMAYAPYSMFSVGAAVLGESGAIYTGCNVENASFGLSMCAERVAVFKAIQGGERRLLALAVDATSLKANHPLSPCGACLQVLCEFITNDAPVFISGAEIGCFADFLPRPFGFAPEAA